jgi:nicotinamidase-related amidase
MDVQKGIIDGLGEKGENYLEHVKQAVNYAHQATVPVFFVVVRFRKGYPELSPNNKMFSAIKNRSSSFSMEETSPLTDPLIEPQGSDLVIAKKRVSAFAGSDLEMLLNAQGITKLVLCGVSTSGVVLSTLRYAADKDYHLKVLSDCCVDHDEEVHKILLDKVFPRQAEVMTSTDWAKTLQ